MVSRVGSFQRAKRLLNRSESPAGERRYGAPSLLSTSQWFQRESTPNAIRQLSRVAHRVPNCVAHRVRHSCSCRYCF